VLCGTYAKAFFSTTLKRPVSATISPCVRADIEGIKISAGTHRVVYRDYHRLLGRVFPYGVFYTIENDTAIVIWAIIDLRRDPRWIRKRLGL
jgi:hypothetical protein